MPKREKGKCRKVYNEINPAIDSQTDTPSMGSWPVSPAPILEDVDCVKKPDKKGHKDRLP